MSMRPRSGRPGIPLMASEIDSDKKRGNITLFWVHIALAVVILCGFVYAIAHQ